MASPAQARRKSISKPAASAEEAQRASLVLLPEIADPSRDEPLRSALRREASGMALRHSSPKPRRRAWRGSHWPRATSLAHALLCSCRIRTCALSSSTGKARPSYKRGGASSIRRATWPLAAKLSDCVVILASATPSLETLVNAQAGRYARVQLPSRHGAGIAGCWADRSQTRSRRKSRWLSPEADHRRLALCCAGEQSLFYMNRRGYAPLTLCRACMPHHARRQRFAAGRHRYSGPRCLPPHRRFRSQSRRMPRCKAVDTFPFPIGPGVERIEEVRDSASRTRRSNLLLRHHAQLGEAVRDLMARMEE